MSTDRYVSPLLSVMSKEMVQYIFSPDKKFRTWRRLPWIALAETEKELGLNITDE